jgi:hypothetical protein
MAIRRIRGRVLRYEAGLGPAEYAHQPVGCARHTAWAGASVTKTIQQLTMVIVQPRQVRTRNCGKHPFSDPHE